MVHLILLKFMTKCVQIKSGRKFFHFFEDIIWHHLPDVDAANPSADWDPHTKCPPKPDNDDFDVNFLMETKNLESTCNATHAELYVMTMDTRIANSFFLMKCFSNLILIPTQMQ